MMWKLFPSTFFVFLASASSVANAAEHHGPQKQLRGGRRHPQDVQGRAQKKYHPLRHLNGEPPMKPFGDNYNRTSLVDCLYSAVAEPGYVVLPQDPTYRAEADVHSKFWMGYPKALAVPADEESVANVIACGREYGARVVPRSGGHGNSGNSATTGTVIIKLHLMNNVTLGDDMASVKVGAGSTAGNAAYHLSAQSNYTRTLPIGQKPSVGMSGLTLGGGYGFLTRNSGLLCDNILSLRAALTTGEIVVATKDNEYKDLVWASCGGGGGSFAIVTEFTYKTTVVPNPLTYYDSFEISIEGPEGQENIRKYQKLAMAMDKRTTMNLEAEGGGIMKMTGIFLGSKDKFMAALDAADPDEALFSHSEEEWKPFEGTIADAELHLSGWNTTVEEDLTLPWWSERKYYSYKGFFTADDEYLDETAVGILLDYLDPENGQVWEFQAMGGADSAFSAVGVEDTAFPHRRALFAVNTKSTAETVELGNERFGRMSKLYYSLSNAGYARASYVNHQDLELWDWKSAYYGIQSYDLGSSEFLGTVAMLEEVNDKYDPIDLMAGQQLF